MCRFRLGPARAFVFATIFYLILFHLIEHKYLKNHPQTENRKMFSFTFVDVQPLRYLSLISKRTWNVDVKAIRRNEILYRSVQKVEKRKSLSRYGLSTFAAAACDCDCESRAPDVPAENNCR